jgi:SAM-dependent methyltransferase
MDFNECYWNKKILKKGNKMLFQEWNPGKLLEISGSYWKTCALHAGVKLDLFSIIGNNELTADDVAGHLDAHVDGVERFLNALTAMGLILKIGGRFKNTEGAKAFLVKKAPGYIGYMIMHHHHLMESWNRLDKSVITGRPVGQNATFSNEEWRENFLMGMYNMAMSVAPKLVPEIDLSEKRRFLDLGGGPGTYAIHFCLYNQKLKATVYDLSTTRPFAEKTIAGFGLSHRIDFQDGDYTKMGIEGKFDVVWLSHILHGESPETCRDIIQKAVAALEPGGMIIVHEFILNDSMDGPLFPALFSLNMLLVTDAGRSYSESQIGEMLSQAGAKNIRRIPVKTPNDTGIITGIVG